MVAAFLVSTLIIPIFIAYLTGSTPMQRQQMFNMGVWCDLIYIPTGLLGLWLLTWHSECIHLLSVGIAVVLTVIFFRKSSPVNWYGYVIKILRK